MKEWEERLSRLEKWLEEYKEENKIAFAEMRKNISGISDGSVDIKTLTEETNKRVAENWAWLENYKKENKKAIDEMRKNISGISDGSVGIKTLTEETNKRVAENWAWLENYKEENKIAFAEMRKNISGISDGSVGIKTLTEETNKRVAENWAWLENYKEENKIAFAEMRKNISGISDGNGMFAEEYFYNTLDETMTFGGYHFDFVDRHLKRKRKGADGKRVVDAEYDVLMVNDVAACIVEVKYRARKNNIDELIEKVGKFRIHFPAYANHKVFLGIGAMSFDDGVENAAKTHGIGIMKQNGDAVEIDDADLKAY